MQPRGLPGSVLALGAAFLGGACATGRAPDGSRGAAETAILQAEETAVDALDGRDVYAGSRYVIAPGPHTVTFHPTDGVGHATEAHSLTVCFEARAGQLYAAVASEEGDGRRRPLVLERGTNRPALIPCAAEGTAAPLPGTGPSPPAPGPPFHPGHRPGATVELGLGAAFGGDELAALQRPDAHSESYRAGEGGLFVLGASWVPLWFRDRVGLGLAWQLGVKAWSAEADDGELRLVRFPASVAARSLVRFGEQWFLLAGAGLHKELRTHLSGTGAAAADQRFSHRIGRLGEAGVYHALGRHLGLAALLRYTEATYETSHAAVDASSLGLLVSLSWGL